MLSRPAQGARGSRRKGLQRRKSLQPHGEGRQRQARGAEAPPAECLWSLRPEGGARGAEASPPAPTGRAAAKT